MMRTYVVIALAGLTGCATTTQIGSADDVPTAAVDTIRAHARAVRDHVRAERAAFKAALGLDRAAGHVIDVRPAEPVAARDAHRRTEPLSTIERASPRQGRGHPARDAAAHPVRIEVQPSEMLTPEGGLQPSAARSLARMAKMAREHGGEFTVSVPRPYLEAAVAIRAAAPGATILSAEGIDNFRLVVVTVED